MIYFNIYIIFLLILLIFLFSKQNRIESFSTKETIILLGDSVFKNNLYVSNEYSIESILTRELPNFQNQSQDGAMIVDLYSQMEKIPNSLNNKNTLIFISCGGNDILDYYYHNEISNNFLEELFNKYSNFIDSLCVKMNECKIILLDIYYPQNVNYRKFYKLISVWNQKLNKFAVSKDLQVICISEIIVHENDFIYDIEPSQEGGQKIAQLIINYTKQ